MKKSALLILAVILMSAFKTDKPAYRLFTEKGKAATYESLLKDAAESDIVFFGEIHNNPICHWLEYELAVDLYKQKGKNLILAAEMFESDNQLLIDELLSGKIKEKNFEAEAKLWPNYKTDYKPLVSLAKDSGLVFVASNIPRRYAALVNASGFEGLSSLAPEAQKLFAPLPVKYDPELACYKDILKSMGGAMHGTDNIAKAQAIKDATMAYFILKNWQPGKTILHFNGSYHSDNFQGIIWYLKQVNPSLKIITLSSTQQKILDDLDETSKGKANFNLVTPESMTTSSQ